MMQEFFENVFLGIFLAAVAVGGLALILIVQPWFWLAMITLILVTHL